ncbi:hypothetical protein CFOL_v3_17523, partial [Cephalotus follicularis]
SLGKDMGYVGS